MDKTRRPYAYYCNTNTRSDTLKIFNMNVLREFGAANHLYYTSVKLHPPWCCCSALRHSELLHLKGARVIIDDVVA